MNLPDATDFADTNIQAAYRQWEHGIITADHFREKAASYGNPIDDGLYFAMLREEIDAQDYYAGQEIQAEASPTWGASDYNR